MGKRHCRTEKEKPDNRKIKIIDNKEYLSLNVLNSAILFLII